MKLVRSLEFDPAGFEDLAQWVENDRRKALKIIGLIKDIQRNPLEGIGQPEKLKAIVSISLGLVIRNVDEFLA